ncbi:MAG: enoyl-CoA hydratase/isomerase family protein [Pseudomonadales bacterium]|nr:enoyl-CoA hydratase/isomerase family protein [Halioglobus sp.]MCP5123593.1 enoyl-CoA hydratase/isomerase family protein [Pseudomonadales bacterium]MCP5193570.1 enoyl-CoA hydratase/isomerase family protein [Pseudomonadales bacterium]
MNASSPLRVDCEDGVMVLCNTDAPWNRMNFAYMDGLERAVADAAADPQVRALIFTADGQDNFSVGMDLKQLVNEAESRGGFDAVLDQRRRVLGMIENMPKPSIATLFGYCLGGGLELPLACHFRLAADTGARIGLPELELGTVPAWGGTARLSRCIGRDRALDMILRVRKIDGQEALNIGLVHSVYPVAELKNAAMALARELASRPPIAVAGVLDCVVGSAHKPLQQALDDERAAVRRCAASSDQAEGLQAFIEKRVAVFTGT